MHRVVALALPWVVAFDLSIPAQVFGRGDEGGYAFTTCTPGGGLVPSTTGFAVHVEHDLSALDQADTVVVPGYSPREHPGPDVAEALHRAADRGARVVSVCTGAFALAAVGLLDGLRATTHWAHAAELADRHPHVEVDPDVLWVDHGTVATSAGLAAGIDLCLHLVRTDHGAQAAASIARRMVVAPHRDGGQAQWLRRPVPPAGEGLAPTCEWALGHLADPLTVADLARHAGWAPRTLTRRFLAETGRTPLQWLTAQRVAHARQLLETSDLSVQTIATRTGLGTAANFRTHFVRDTATTPSAYRAAYQGGRRLPTTWRPADPTGG